MDDAQVWGLTDLERWWGHPCIGEQERWLLVVVMFLFFFLLHSGSLNLILHPYAVNARIVGGYEKTETEQETGTGKVGADARPRNEPNSRKIIRTVIPYMFTALYSC